MRFDSRTQEVKAAVCQIRTQSGHGTGFLVSDNGAVVTNHHVIAGATQIAVRFTHDAGYRQARIIRQDPTYDLALLVTTPPAGIDPLELVDSRSAEGQVWTLGHPQGQLEGPEPSVTAGVISKRGRLRGYAGGRVELLQTSAVTKPGSSGGPVVNQQGDVLAVHVAAPQNSHAGIHFSIPSNIAAAVLGVPMHDTRNDDFSIVPTANSSYAQIWSSFTATIPGRLLTSAFLSGVGLSVPWLIAWNYLAPGVEWLSGEEAVLAVFITGVVGGVALFRNWIFKRKPRRSR